MGKKKLDWADYPNFTEREFRCRCGKCPGSKHPPMDPLFMRALQRTRNHYGKAINIASGYRCAAHNKAIGGAKDSSHVRGTACDPKLPISGRDKMALIKAAIRSGMLGFGYGARLIHFDRDTKYGSRSWTYGK